MTTPKGVRLRKDQLLVVEKFLKKTGFSEADYVRSAVDLFQELSDSQMVTKIMESRVKFKKKAVAAISR